MIVKQDRLFEYGFTSITQQQSKHTEMLLDFGILKLKTGGLKTFPAGRERAWLLIAGSATFMWEGKVETVTRNSCFEEAPYVLHVSRDTEVTVKTESDCEIWSSYPPHDHPQPEIYHYRFFPPQGFGISVLDDEAHVVKNGYTTLIGPDRTHSQGAAPGYAMYYIWMIPHLPDNRWLPSTRYYRDEHKWLLEPDVKIWPERQSRGV